MTSLTQRIHAELLATAEIFGAPLVAAISANGPQRLRRSRTDTVCDALTRAVAGQQLSVKAASTIWGRVLAAADGQELATFFSTVRTETLRACGLSGAKTAAVQAIGRAALDGELDERTLARLDHAERSARLLRLRGVGPWTADMLGMFYFLDPDIWPDGDVSARGTLARLTSKRRKTALTAARFAPHRSYLALHMWAAADATPG